MTLSAIEDSFAARVMLPEFFTMLKKKKEQAA